MAGKTTSRAPIGLLGGLFALMVFLAGCAEEPKPVETSAVDSAARHAADAGTERQPVVDDHVPDEPPVQSEPATAGDAGPRPVTPEELQAIIAQSAGKVVLVDFWATWCKPCREQFPHTVELSKTHATDLVVLAVSMDNTDEATLADVNEFYVDHASGNVQPLINETSGEADPFAAFEITGGALPHYKLYGRDGQLIKAFGGEVDNPLSTEDVDKAIVAAIGE